MRLSIIDLGTNSVRFDVHQVSAQGKTKTLYREKIMVRLGEGVFNSGRLDECAIQRTLHAFERFKKISLDFHVKKMIALGTSALRDARDAPQLVQKIEKKTGIKIRVIPGREEARLIALGILAHERFKKGKLGFIDIGGGSTELSLLKNRKITHYESFQLGTARIQQVFLKQNPPKPEDIRLLRSYIRRSLLQKMTKESWPQVSLLIGSSGTIKALAKIGKKSEGKRLLKLAELSGLIQKMSKMNSHELSQIPGLEARRVDMILAGAILLEESMKVLGAQGIVPTPYSLRDGVLEEQVRWVKHHIPSQMALNISDLYERAIRFGETKKHLDQMLEMSQYVFRRLKTVHLLEDRWRVYLDAAVILRNIGEMISFIDHARWSYFLVKNLSLPFIEEWEEDLVAELCRNHEKTMAEWDEIPFKKNKKVFQIYKRLSVLLGVVDALDPEVGDSLPLKKVSLKKQWVTLGIMAGAKTELILNRIELRRAFFRAVFKKDLVGVGIK